MATIAELVVRLAADSADFRNDLEKAARKTDSFGQSVKRSFLAVGAIVAAGGAAFGALAKKSIDSFDDISKAADRLGTTTEQLSRLSYAADLAGVSQDTFITSLERMQRNLAAAAQGTGTATDAIDALGLSAESLANMSPDESFLAITDALATIPNQAQRAQVAYELFGRSGIDLLNVMQQGRAGIEASGDELERFGGVIDGNAAKAAEAFNDNLTRLQYGVTGLSHQLVEQMLPTLLALTDSFIATEKEAGAFDETARQLATGFKIVLSVGAVVKGVFDAIGKQIGGLAAILVQFFTGRWAEAWATAKEFPLIALEEIRESAETLAGIWHGPADMIEAAAPKVGAQLAAPIKLASTEIDAAAEKIRQEIEGIVTGLQDQLATFGMTSREADIYRLGVLKAGDENLKLARSIDATLTALEAQQELMDAGARVYEQTRTAAEQLDIQQQHLNELYRAGAIDYETYLRALEQSEDTYAKVGEAAEETSEKMSVFADEAARNIQGFLGDETFNLLQGNFDDIGSRFKALIDRMVAEALAAQLAKKLFGDSVDGGEGGGWIGMAISAYQARANGGPVTAGRAYMVGERGPEIFAPNVSGQIIPNSAANDSGARAVTINAPISISAPQGRIGQESITQLQAGLYRAGLRSARRNG